MKTQIKKETLKEAIRIAIKRYKKNDSDFVTLLINQCNDISYQAFSRDFYNIQFVDIILSIVCLRERANMNITYETIYKVFELLGFEILEQKNETNQKFDTITEGVEENYE